MWINKKHFAFYFNIFAQKAPLSTFCMLDRQVVLFEPMSIFLIYSSVLLFAGVSATCQSLRGTVTSLIALPNTCDDALSTSEHPCAVRRCENAVKCFWKRRLLQKSGACRLTLGLIYVQPARTSVKTSSKIHHSP